MKSDRLLGIIRVKKGVSNYYIKNWMDSDYFWRQVKQKVAGGAKDNLNTTWLKEFKLSIPTFEEQQKIADCLSDLDDLITAETESIEALQTHKKGLMQNLFPNP
jgi:type I restriction enzyme S subunit